MTCKFESGTITTHTLEGPAALFILVYGDDYFLSPLSVGLSRVYFLWIAREPPTHAWGRSLRASAESSQYSITHKHTHPFLSVKRGPEGVVGGPLSGRLLADKGAAPSDKEPRLCVYALTETFKAQTRSSCTYIRSFTKARVTSRYRFSRTGGWQLQGSPQYVCTLRALGSSTCAALASTSNINTMFQNGRARFLRRGC